MPQLYMRKVSLVAGSDEGAIDLADLRVVFKVRQWDIQTPNSLVARVYNVSDETAARVQKEFDRVVLQAGYRDGPFGKIFDGTIVQVRRGRENATDTYLELIASDGDEAYNFAIVNTSLAAGATAKDRLEVLTKAMGGHGVGKGYTPDDLGSAALPRGVVMFGMARDEMRGLAASTGTKWSIQNGKLQMVPETGFIPGEAIVLTAATGMVGLPEQTQDGIRVRSLLNPEIRMGGRVKIDNASIQRAPLDIGLQGFQSNAFLPRVTDDGIYRVIVADHVGDTRGNDFYSDLICIALDDGVTPGLLAKGYG